MTGKVRFELFKAAAIFSDHMVLQRGKKICVFGTGENNENVTAILTVPAQTGKAMLSKAACIVGDDGKWMLQLPEQDIYAQGCTLKLISGTTEILFEDIAIGEVFLAGGQSNMELELGTSTDGREVLGTYISEDVRFYYTQKKSYFDEAFFESETNTAWQKFGDEWTKSWSAVGFFFARKLARELNCPVGIIGCNWGGTSACCWMSREALLSSENTRIYADEYDNSADRINKTEQEQIADYEEYVRFQTEWDRKSGEIYAANPGITWDEVQERIGKCRYPGPLNAGSFLRPAGLYETMLKRVAPYTLQGFIYYQGESDDHRPNAYFDMMRLLIEQWRKDWQDPKAYFLLTQLTMHRYKDDSDKGNWCIIRESQQRVAELIPGTGMAVIIDQGEFNEIHPKYKRRVGERLALQALYKVYGRLSEEEASSPIYRDCTLEKDGVRVTFDNCIELQSISRLYGNIELENAVTQKLLGFELAGENGVYYEAEAEIADKNTVIVKCPEVAVPKGIRYLWKNYCECTLYSERRECIGDALPVAPFRCEIQEVS